MNLKLQIFFFSFAIMMKGELYKFEIGKKMWMKQLIKRQFKRFRDSFNGRSVLIFDRFFACMLY